MVKSLWPCWIVLAVLIFSLHSPSAKQSILGISEVMQMVEKNYADAQTFKSTFRQIYLGRNFGEIKSGGKVYFKKPGMMKWLYKKPHKKTIASYKDKLWIYDTKDSQIILDKNFEKEKMPSSLSFLWGEKRLSKVFNYKMLSVESRGSYNLYTVELIPKEEVPNVKNLHFIISTKDFLIHETSVFDLFGNENRLIFSNIKLGSKIKRSFFYFKPPKNVVVVELPARLKR